MSLSEFVAYWTMKPQMDFDGKYGNQCVDLFRFYLRDVLKIPQPPGVGGAAELFTNYNPAFFERIFNAPGIVPDPGNIAIWGPSGNNEFGHVAVVTQADAKSLEFESFDINYPSEGYKNSSGIFIGTGRAHLQKHIWTENILGWLKPLKQPEGNSTMANYYPISEPHIDLTNQESVKVAIDTWVRVVNGEFINKEEHERQMLSQLAQLTNEKNSAIDKAFKEGVETGKQMNQSPVETDPELISPNMSEWEPNGLTIEITKDNTKYINNYRRKP